MARSMLSTTPKAFRFALSPVASHSEGKHYSDIAVLTIVQ